MGWTLLIIALLVGLYMAWNIGANDVANAISTSVGSKALTLTKAIIIAAIFEFAGACLLGGQVSKTIQQDVLNISIFALEPEIYVYGMVSALLATGAWLQLASYFGMPVSTTHSLIGALLGFGLIQYGLKGINWTTVNSIFASWLLSPLLGGIIAYVVFSLMRKNIFYAYHPIKKVKKFAPSIVAVLFFLFSLSILFKGPTRLHLNFSFLQACFFSICISLLIWLTVYFLIRSFLPSNVHKYTDEERKLFQKKKQQEQMLIELSKINKHLLYASKIASHNIREQIIQVQMKMKELKNSINIINNNYMNSQRTVSIEKVFAYLQIISVALMAFAHGSNDVSNAIGPMAGVFSTIKTHSISIQSQIPLWILALGGIGIIVGLATWGWRVVKTIGGKITSLTPSRGFAAEFSAAVTIIIASKLALPVSTTHALVGAVLGVGLARGIGALNLSVIKDIVLAWIITIPAGALFSICFFYLLRLIIV